MILMKMAAMTTVQVINRLAEAGILDARGLPCGRGEGGEPMNRPWCDWGVVWWSHIARTHVHKTVCDHFVSARCRCSQKAHKIVWESQKCCRKQFAKSQNAQKILNFRVNLLHSRTIGRSCSCTLCWLQYSSCLWPRSASPSRAERGHGLLICIINSLFLSIGTNHQKVLWRLQHNSIRGLSASRVINAELWVQRCYYS